MKHLTLRFALAVSLIALAVGSGVPAVSADAVYHSEHLAFAPVGDLPLHSGFVENIHANGEVIFAHENYVLNGAELDATYQVVLMIYPLDTSCGGGPILELLTATISTNVVGNGKAQAVFKMPVDPSFHNLTVGGRWQLRDVATATVPYYQTGCTIIHTD